LNCPNVITKKVPRNSKWECNALEWNPHLSDGHIFANAVSLFVHNFWDNLSGPHLGKQS